MSPTLRSPRAEGPTPPTRVGPRLLGAGLVALSVVLVVAALASGSRDSDQMVTAPRGQPGSGVVEVVFTLVLLLGVCMWIAVIVLQLKNRDSPSGKKDGPRRKKQSVVMGALILVLLLWLITRFATGTESNIEVDITRGDLPPPYEPEAVDGGFHLGLLIGFLLLVLTTVAAIVWAQLRPERGPDDEMADDEVADEQRRVVIAVFDDAIAELRHHPDPREAVIAAWARLERMLQVVGVERDRAETPVRYLAKVLTSVEASGPGVTRLTDALERALYSDHEITRPMQLDAVDALVAVRDELHILALMESSQRPTP